MKERAFISLLVSVFVSTAILLNFFVYTSQNNIHNITTSKSVSPLLLEGGQYTVIAETSYEKGPWLASPSLIRRRDGTLIASYDFNTSPIHTYICISKNGGKSWKQTAVIKALRWGNLVEVKDEVYIVGVHGVNDTHGLRVSKMNSYSNWTKPTRIIDDIPEVHTGNVGIVVEQERLHLAIQKGRRNSWTIVSASIHDNLLDKKSWNHSNSVKEPMKPRLTEMQQLMGVGGGAYTQEGVMVPWNGGLLTIARVSDNAICNMAGLFFYDVKSQKLEFMHFTTIPGLGVAKPAIVYDSVSNLYWMLSNYNRDKSRNVSDTHLGYIQLDNERCLIDRSILGLFYATQPMDTWHLAGFVVYSPDWAHMATYPSMLIDGKDIILVSRSHLDTPLDEMTVNHGMGPPRTKTEKAHSTANNHNANKITFHRITDFRQLVHPMMYYKAEY